MVDYKKLYEDLVDRVKTMAKAQPLVTKKAIEMHFPEIVESEDERIRKELIAEVKEQIDCIPAPDCRDKEDDKALKRLNKWLTWLEEHKEEDSYAHRKTQEFIKGFKRVQCYKELSEWEKMFDNIASKYANRKNDEGYNNSWFVKERAGDMLYYAKQEIERQNNQKLDAIDISEEQKDKLQEENVNANSELLNNGVKPKFKAGDWVVVNDGRIGRIIECTKDFADVDLEFSCLSTRVNSIRSWTIQDAKDGDVLVVDNITFIYKRTLANHIVSYCKLINNGFFEPFDDARTCCEGNIYIHPATKEQRDTLFTRMKESGYEWDAEKKELKKIEQKSQRIVSAEAKEAMYDKSTDKVEPKFHVGDMVKRKDNPHLTYILKRLTDDGDYEFHAIGKDGNEGCTCFATVKYQDEWELVEQNPACSEEDKKLWLHDDDIFLDAAKMIVADSPRRSYGGVHKKEIVPWFLSLKERLKSLKDRVQPQPKQEWSEEDEARFESCIKRLQTSDGYDTINVKWLKDLKERVGKFEDGYKVGFSAAKYNQWKPSSEQMYILNWVANILLNHNGVVEEEASKKLQSLYNDLKKLREE